MRAGHGIVQGRKHTHPKPEQYPDGVRGALLPARDGKRQDLPWKEGKSDGAWNADSHRDSPDRPQLVSDAVLHPLAAVRAQAGADPMQHTAGSTGVRSGHCYHVPYSHLSTTTPGEMI